MSKYTTQVRKSPVKKKPAKATKPKALPGATVKSKVPVVRHASVTADTINLAGGRSFKMSDKMELTTTAMVGLIEQKGNLVSFNTSPYAGSMGHGIRCYESRDAREARIKKLVGLSGIEYAAKLALSMRIEHGHRAISHLLGGVIASECSGVPWADDFFNQLFVRGDDPCQTVAAYQKHGKRTKLNKHQALPLPAALKRGISRFFSKLDYYKMAKYANGQGWPTLRDLAKMVRPVPTAKNKKALADLIKGELKNTDTWEAKLSAAGQSKGEVSKADVWKELITAGELGQLALLRNLRNIATECDEATIKLACKQLTDKDAIRKNGILPMQYLKAYEVIGQSGVKCQETIRAAIDDAVEIAVGNVPSVGDSVLIAIDESGSMQQLERDNAALFAAVLLKSNPNADLMYFAAEARYAEYNRKLPIMELMTRIKAGMRSGGTNFNLIFQTANKAYDSILILSDQEGWMGSSDAAGGQNIFNQRTVGGAPTASMATYKRQFDCDPTIFTFDLGGDGALMFREDGIIALAGFSFHVFKLLNILKRDRTKLVDVIDKIQIGKPLPRHGEEEEV